MDNTQNIELDINFISKCNESDFFTYLELIKQLESKIKEFKEQHTILNKLISKYGQNNKV